MSGEAESPRTEADRLAEMVEELTGADRGASLHAVREHRREASGDALEVVAGAMVRVDRPPPIRLHPYLTEVYLDEHGQPLPPEEQPTT